MPRKSILYILLLFGIQLSGNSQIDSLFGIWQDKNQSDTTRMNALYDFAFKKLLFSKPDSVLELAQHQYEFAQKENHTKHLAKAILLEGLALNQLGKYQEALSKYKSSIQLFGESNNYSWAAEGYIHAGNLQQDILAYDSSYTYFDNAISIFEELGDEGGIGKALIRKSYSARNLANYVLSMDYGIQALKNWESDGDQSGIADAYINLSDVLYYQGNYEGSIEYSQKALEFLRQLDDEEGVANAYREIGESYLILGDYQASLENINNALHMLRSLEVDPLNIGSVINSRGNVYKYLEEYDKALADYQESFTYVEDIGFELGIMAITANIGHVYTLKEEYKEALPYTLQAIEMMEQSGNLINIVENYGHAATAYAGLNNYEAAYTFHKKYTEIKDSIFTVEKDHTLSELRTQYETEKKEEQIALLEREALLNEQAELRNKQIRILLMALAILLVLLAIGLLHRLVYTRKSRATIEKEKERSDNLLLNILPSEIAEELKSKGKAQARDFDLVTILFTDFASFTQTSTNLSAQVLVNELNTCFKEFDRIITRYKIEKIKTIGDAYMAAGGLPVPTNDSAKNTVLAALDMQQYIRNRKAEKNAAGEPAFEMRAGIHSGPVVAGIVGVKKFQYDVWGDTVNISNRMESTSEIGKVNISKATYDLIRKDPHFTFERRGKIKAKGKGKMEMWFVARNTDGVAPADA